MAELLTRQSLIARLGAALEPVSGVHAAWLEGADAAGRADAYSDIDLWLDVEAGQEERAFAVVRDALTRFGPLDVDAARPHPDPLVQQRFYRSVGLSPFSFVDVCVQVHGRDATFGPHDFCRVLFDRSGVIRTWDEPWTIADVQAAAQALAGQRWRFLLVEKEVRRGHRLEALAYYHSEVLGPLVELLRLRYQPGKRGYGLKHVYADLPPDAVDRLEDLYACTRLDQFAGCARRAERWFDRLLMDMQGRPES